MKSLIVVLALLMAVAVAGPIGDRITSLPGGYGSLLSANYAGYVPVGDSRKLFYWFVESENQPKTDPLLLWLNGGPGCSSLLGQLSENGVYTMRHGGFALNEFRWTTNASVLYMESPAGVGFSVDSNPPIQWNDNNTAEASYVFLQNWFELFPEFKANKLFLGGESYAGHYVPQLANEILEGPDHEMLSRLQGFMVGNPCTGDIGCNNADPTLDVFLTYNGFRPLNQSIPVDPNANYDPYDLLVPTCPNDQLARRVRFSHPILDSYKRRKAGMTARLGGAPVPYGPCLDDHLTTWINREDVKVALHAETNITWSECSDSLNYLFNPNGVVPLYEKFFAKTKWSIMIYSGTSDSIVNFVQTQTIVNSMRRKLKKDEFTAWNYPYVYDPTATQLGGFYLEFEGLSWATVRDAGHMVPEYNPPPAKELFTSFVTTGKPGRM